MAIAIVLHLARLHAGVLCRKPYYTYLKRSGLPFRIGGVLHLPPVECPAMSRGTQVYSVRIPDDLMAKVEEQILSRNAFAPGQPWNRSDFIVIALVEKLKKMARSRSKRPARRAAVRS
jgi:Arc/MetJ-type ribon-helix-helix transcriptional regulator